MVQGILAGCTDYNEQTLEDIVEDIQEWQKLIIWTNKNINKNLEILNKQNKLNSIGTDFKITVVTSLKCFKTFLSDFDKILSSIKKNQITEREVQLIANIGKKAIEYNNEYGKTWNINCSRWKRYGEKWFLTVEEIYRYGRDTAITLQDCLNISKRLEDYKTGGFMINQKNIINGSANIVGVNNGTMNNFGDNTKNLITEIEKAIEEISKEDCPEDTKQPFLELLNDISKNNLTQEKAKRDIKSIISLNLSKTYKILSILSAFATLASYCGIEFKKIHF